MAERCNLFERESQVPTMHTFLVGGDLKYKNNLHPFSLLIIFLTCPFSFAMLHTRDDDHAIERALIFDICTHSIKKQFYQNSTPSSFPSSFCFPRAENVLCENKQIKVIINIRIFHFPLISGRLVRQ